VQSGKQVFLRLTGSQKPYINGTNYQEINDGFLLASVVPSNATFIVVEAYLVTNWQVPQFAMIFIFTD
jgi:hypothetical protein